MKVAIIGTGVAGLTAAHLLHPAHQITIYEAGNRIGGHTNTVRVDEDGRELWIDTGFIVHNDRNYPEFQALMNEIGVETQPSHMSFSVSDGTGGFEYAGTPMGLFARPSNLVRPRFLRMLREFFRFNREARALIGMDGAAPALGEWLEQGNYSQTFIDGLIVPQASAVWSAPPEQMWSFPASFLAEFFDNHGMYSLRGRPRWRTVGGGSHRYVEALVAPFRDRIRVGESVDRIERRDDQVLVRSGSGETEIYDEVVIATHSDQALKMLSDPSDAEREVLGAIPYRHNDVTLHTDSSMMPTRRRAWASWNFHLGADAEPAGGSTVTYWMNNLQCLEARQDYFVTLNRDEAIDPDKVIRRISYDHPVYTTDSVHAQQRHAEINGVNRTRFCGAYWGWGFHEDGVVSARRALEGFGADAEHEPLRWEAGGDPQVLAA